MKANEVPERIYVRVKHDKALNIWNSDWKGVNDIEYINTNAFIEKACKWLEKNKDNSLIKSEDSYLSGYLTDEFIKEFKQAMKGE